MSEVRKARKAIESLENKIHKTFPADFTLEHPWFEIAPSLESHQCRKAIDGLIGVISYAHDVLMSGREEEALRILSEALGIPADFEGVCQ